MAFNPTRVILHCSDTPDYKPDNSEYNKIGAAEIRSWHVDKNGWKDIGYHYCIRQNGVVEFGRPITEIGAHVEGENYNSIGVCLVGRLKFSQEQLNAVVQLFMTLRKTFFIDAERWFCHNEFNDQKTCPNIPANLLRSLLVLIEETLDLIEDKAHDH
jgi:N-acetylmuramoyl-L-alanine amidase